MKEIFFATFTLLVSLHSFAYTPAPSCPDFLDINADYAEAHTGQYSDADVLGVVPGRHTEITTQGTDHNTGNQLQFLPAGESRVIRLGNEQTGGESESLTYHFVVDKDNPVLLVKFAVVLQDPGHDVVYQPRFVMRIMDKNGNLIEDCAEYNVSAGGGISGFQTYGSGTPVRWRDWTSVGLDMSPFAGQEVQVQFATYDCSLSAHFGYAYFTAKCISNKLQMSACAGSSFTLEAPADFASYLWDNGDKTRTTTRTKTGSDMNVSCLVTSATGCQFRLSAYVSSTVAPSSTAHYTETVCQGDAYNKNYYNLPPQMKSGTFTYYNTFFNPNTCSGSVTTTLRLTVLKTYHDIKASICEGDDYTAYGFNIAKPAVGVRRDTLRLKSKSIACDSVLCLELTVSPSFNLPNKLEGDLNPCTNKLTYYEFAGGTDLTLWQWEVPGNAHLVSGSTGSQIQVYFTDDAAGSIILKGENGCGTGAVPLLIKPRQSYENLITDSICSGEVYNRHSFNLGRQDSTGFFAYTHYAKTALGCDSITTLGLYVFPTPTVRIATMNDTILCGSQPVTLYAVADTAMLNIPPKPKIAIGDIYCTDGTIVKPQDYAASGKTYEGIIFYLDDTGEHGWMMDPVSKTHTGLYGMYDLKWSNTESDMTALPYYADSFADIDGYTKTGIMRNNTPNQPNMAAWVVDYDQGWYMPATGQAIVLKNVYSYIKQSIFTTGNPDPGASGTSFWICSKYPNGWNYTTQTPLFASQGAPSFNFISSGIGCGGKTDSNCVIQIKNF